MGKMIQGIKVEVYWNLHKNVWSIRHKGIVIGHVKDLSLESVSFHVGQSGNAKVRREGRKNVHAYVKGTLVAWDRGLFSDGIDEVTYNPYKYRRFVFKSNDKVGCKKAAIVHMNEDRSVWVA